MPKIGVCGDTVPRNVTCEVDNRATTVAKNCSFAERVLWKSAALVLIISRINIERKTASSVVTGDDPAGKLVLLRPQFSNENLAVTSERGYTDFVCTCIRTQSMMELNQKLTKEDTRCGAFTRAKKHIPMQELGVKEGWGVC